MVKPWTGSPVQPSLCLRWRAAVFTAPNNFFCKNSLIHSKIFYERMNAGGKP